MVIRVNTMIKSSYFIRLNVNKQGVTHNLLIPVTQQCQVNGTVDAWQSNGWTVEIDDTPFPGQGINASDIGVHAHV